MCSQQQTFLRNTEGPVEYQKGGVKTTKSKDGTITNKFVNKEGNTAVFRSALKVSILSLALYKYNNILFV